MLLARNRAGAGVGDRVVVGVSEAGLVTAALAAYLVPILGLVGGAVLGQWVGGSAVGAAADPWSLLGAILGFLLALSWLRRYSASLARDPGRHPVVLRRLDGGPLSLPVSFSGH
jgi:sigma-E factor negative regulatory protein RseC